MPETPVSQPTADALQTRTNSGVPVRSDARAKKLRDNLRRRKEAVRSRDDESGDA